MPRTLQLSLTDAQYTDLLTLLRHGEDQLNRIIEDEIDETVLAEHAALKERGIPSLVRALKETDTPAS